MEEEYSFKSLRVQNVIKEKNCENCFVYLKFRNRRGQTDIKDKFYNLR